MTCKKYQNALLLAASNGELDEKLARHLERCSTCRVALRSKTELLSRIDRALRGQVNEEPRAGFLAQLRLQLSKELTARPGSDGVWNVAGAALALVLIAMFYPLVDARQSNVQENPRTPTFQMPRSAEVAQSVRASDSGVRPPHHSKLLAAQRAVRQKPEVLVPPDEQKAFAQFVACSARRDAVAQAVVTAGVNDTVYRKTELPEVSSVDIADLELGQSATGRMDRPDR
jgi:hypothetical protein